MRQGSEYAGCHQHSDKCSVIITLFNLNDVFSVQGKFCNFKESRLITHLNAVMFLPWEKVLVVIVFYSA